MTGRPTRSLNVNGVHFRGTLSGRGRGGSWALGSEMLLVTLSLDCPRVHVCFPFYLNIKIQCFRRSLKCIWNLLGKFVLGGRPGRSPLRPHENEVVAERLTRSRGAAEHGLCPQRALLCPAPFLLFADPFQGEIRKLVITVKANNRRVSDSAAEALPSG